jgi:hypothetical protein
MPGKTSLATILANTQPARLTDRIRKIWPDLMVMRTELLTYGQIVEILREHYGIQIHRKHLASIVLRVKKNPPSGTSPLGRSAVLSQASPRDDRTQADPLHELRLRERAAREEDRKVDEVFKRKTVSDLLRKDQSHGKNSG